MPYYENINVLFIHIPKTGGSIIEHRLNEKTKQTLRNLYPKNELLPKPHDVQSLQHQFYSTLYKYKNILKIDFDNIKIFTIIRNPYDRIISDLFFLGLMKTNDSSETVYDIIKNNYLFKNNLDNHNVPQYKFITNEKLEIYPNIKIFKTENLNDDNKIINDFLGVNINIKQSNVNKNYSKYLNKDSIALINNFYKKDFELFNYKLF